MTPATLHTTPPPQSLPARRSERFACAGRPSYCITESTSLRGAMEALNEVATGLVFVVNDTNVLVGVVSDGDIRRALLCGGALDEPVSSCMTRNFRAVTPDVGRNAVLDLMQAYWLKQVPIIDAQRRLLGVHLLHEMLGHVLRPNWAVILAGGKGTRLRPITESIPKPMIAVAGRPILERIVLHLMSFGVQRIFIAVNHLSEQIKDHFADGKRFGCRIEYLEEQPDEPLGTAGSLALLPDPPEHPTLVINGDLVTQANIADMLAFHERGEHFATMAVRPYAYQFPFGCVTIDDHRVVELEEKPTICRTVNAGMYVLSPAAVQRVPRRAIPITDLFSEAIARGESVGAFMIEGDWIDIGRFDQLREATGE